MKNLKLIPRPGPTPLPGIFSITKPSPVTPTPFIEAARLRAPTPTPRPGPTREAEQRRTTPPPPGPSGGGSVSRVSTTPSPSTVLQPILPSIDMISRTPPKIQPPPPRVVTVVRAGPTIEAARLRAATPTPATIRIPTGPTTFPRRPGPTIAAARLKTTPTKLPAPTRIPTGPRTAAGRRIKPATPTLPSGIKPRLPSFKFPSATKRPSEVRGLTVKESQALKRSKSGFFQFFSGIGLGFQPGKQRALGRAVTTLPIAQQAGIAASFPLAVIGQQFAANPARARIATRSFLKTPVGQFVSELAGTTARAVGIVEAAPVVSRLTAPKAQRAAIGRAGFRDVVAAGFAAQREAVSKIGIVPLPGKRIAETSPTGKITTRAARTLSFGSIAGELPFVGNILSKGTFETTVRERFSKQGLSGKDLNVAVAAAKRQRIARNTGETVALLEVSRSSEAIGRGLVSKGFAKAAKAGTTFPASQTFGKVFKIAAPRIAVAGSVEGFSQEIAQQRARGRPINVKQAVGTGVFGAAAAGVLGGSIAGLRLRNPKISKAIELSTFISDPFEKPGDLLQDLAESIARKSGRKVAATPSLILSVPTPSVTIGVGTPTRTTTKTAGKSKTPIKTPTIIVTPTTVKTSTPTPTPTTTKTPTPVVTPTPLPVIFSITKPSPVTPTPLPVPVAPVPVTPTPVVPIAPVPSPIISPIQTPIPVPVPTTSPVSVPIPVSTPFPRLPIPPPVPLSLPFGSGGGGAVSARRRKTFINELAAANSLLRTNIGRRASRKIKPKKTIPKSKKLKKKGINFFEEAILRNRLNFRF